MGIVAACVAVAGGATRHPENRRNRKTDISEQAYSIDKKTSTLCAKMS
jgi:hypothetical protein